MSVYGDVTAGADVCMAQTIGGDSLYGCLTDGSGGRRKGSVMSDPLLTLEGRGLGWGIRAASCPAEQLARQVGGDSLSCHPSIHCLRTSKSSLAFGDRQLLCLDSQWGQG